MRLKALAVPVAMLALAASTVAAGSADGAPARASAITLSVKQGYPVKLTGPASVVDVYDVGEDATAFCRGGTPLAAGWTSSVPTPVMAVSFRLSGDNSYLNLDLRRPLTGGSFKASAICAKGKGLGAAPTSAAGETVSCGKKLALGVPLSTTWPYNESAVRAEPNGPKAWRYVNPPRGRASALCVNASAFSQITVVKKSSTFGLGQKSAAVTATCPGARRVLSWGYTAGVMDQNVWKSADTNAKLSVPFISASQAAAGGKRWKLTFSTPDQQPAKAIGSIGINVTCGVPT